MRNQWEGASALLATLGIELKPFGHRLLLRYMLLNVVAHGIDSRFSAIS